MTGRLSDERLRAFFGLLTPEETHEMFQCSGFEGELAERCWRFCEMQGPPPAKILIEVYKPDVDRFIAEVKRQRKLERRAKRARGGTA